jgi:hypothetical protein
MASKWGCILLLDEADIFLAERTREDYVRNGLVAGESILMLDISQARWLTNHASLPSYSRVLQWHSVFDHESSRRF